MGQWHRSSSVGWVACPCSHLPQPSHARSSHHSSDRIHPVHLVHVVQGLYARTRAWDKCYVLAPLDTLGIPWLRDAPQIAEEDHWQGVGEVVASHLGLEGKAPQALVVLALGLPTLEDHRQVLAGSPATGFRIASLTGSVKVHQAAVLTLAQTTLKLAARPAAEERLAKQPGTRQSAPAQGITLATHLFPVGHSLPRTSADQILVAPTPTVNLALTTGLAKIDQCAFATKDTEETV